MHHIALRIALFISAGIIAIGAWNLHAQLKARVAQQISSAGIWQQWQTEAADLKPVQARWEQAIPPSSGLQDHLAVQRRLDMQRHQLALDTSHFTVISIDNYTTPEGKSPGIYRICVGSSGSEPVLHLTAASPEAAATAIAELGKRPDLSFSGVKLSHEQNAIITLEKPCIMTRA